MTPDELTAEAVAAKLVGGVHTGMRFKLGVNTFVTVKKTGGDQIGQGWLCSCVGAPPTAFPMLFYEEEILTGRTIL